MSTSSDVDEILKDTKLQTWDIVVIVGYFVAVVGVGLWSSCRNRGSTKGYFLAGRSMHWIPVGASLFASNIGSGHFVGLAGSGASTGIGVGIFELSATFVLLLLGWVFVPVYIAAGVFTMPEYLRKRFGGQRIRIYLSSLSLILYIFTKISADLFSGAVFLEKAIGWGIYESAGFLLLLAMVFTVAGGLTAVIWTDFAQTCIMLIGATVLAVLSYIKVGGYVQLVSKFMGSESQSHLTRRCLSGALNSSICQHAADCGTVPANSMHFFRSASDPFFPWPGMTLGLTISSVWYWCSDQVMNDILGFVEVNKVVDVSKFGSMFEALTHQFFSAYSPDSISSNISCGAPPDYSMHFMRPATLTTDLPWTGVVFGITISGVWYWCTDQVIVQRALAAKNLSHARAGTILAGFLKFTPLWLLVLPGMVSRILYPSVVGCSSEDECLKACGTKSGCTNMAYPLLVLKLMPEGARGLMIAVMLSALMSSLTSIFNSSSTIFTMDIWTRIRTKATEAELLVVGRVFVVVLVGVSVAWIPVVKGFPELFHYIQQVTSFLTPPVGAIYVLAVSWKRVNEHGAFWSLMCGLVIGAIRFIVEFSYGSPPGCGSSEKSNVPDIISKVHYLHFGCILFGITVIIAIVISLLTKPINPKKLRRLTYMSREEPGERLDQDADDNLPDHLQELQSSETVAGASTDQLTDGKTKLESNVENIERKLPWYRVAVNWICGIEKQAEGEELSDAELAELEKKNLSIDEDRKWRIVNSVLAIILILCTTFLWAFFA